MRRSDVRGGIGIALVIFAIVGVVLFIGLRNEDAQLDIDSCIRRGGTPIVTGDRGVVRYHGCAVP